MSTLWKLRQYLFGNLCIIITPKKKQKKKTYLTLGNTPNQTAMTVTACLTEAHAQTHTLLSHTQRQKVKNTAESIYQDISWQQPSKHISVPKRFDHSSPRGFHFIAKAV